jgi:AcrR family transcriptional regulator
MKKRSLPPPIRGRKAEARLNDGRILEAARRVFLANPKAPISAVASEAGVGVSALYLRYRSKEELLRRLCSDGLKLYIAEAEAALADDQDPWTAYAGFMQRIVDADTHSLVLKLSGKFKPGKALFQEAAKAQELNVRLFERTKAAGVIRADVGVVDIALLFEQLAAVQIGDPRRTVQLRRRYLALILDALRAPAAKTLPGPPPVWPEVNNRWDT